MSYYVRSSGGTRDRDFVRVELDFGRGGLEKERSLFINMWRESTEGGG